MKKNMKKNMKKVKRIVLTLGCVLCMSVAMFGCGQNADVKVDYPDETAFETALNNGDNLEGKTVEICVAEFEPQSVFGYNIMAGEHLNFVSPENPEVKEGDRLIVKVVKVKSVLKSWIISYEIVEK